MRIHRRTPDISLRVLTKNEHREERRYCVCEFSPGYGIGSGWRVVGAILTSGQQDGVQTALLSQYRSVCGWSSLNPVFRITLAASSE
jgi:hypothetical protein